MNIETVENVFKEVFGDDHLKIFKEMSAKDVEGWDSFNHINLIVALEEALNVEFTTDEIASMSNVGELIVILQQKGLPIAW